MGRVQKLLGIVEIAASSTHAFGKLAIEAASVFFSAADPNSAETGWKATRLG